MLRRDAILCLTLATAREVARRLHAVPLPDSWDSEQASAWRSEHLPAGAIRVV